MAAPMITKFGSAGASSASGRAAVTDHSFDLLYHEGEVPVGITYHYYWFRDQAQNGLIGDDARLNVLFYAIWIVFIFEAFNLVPLDLDALALRVGDLVRRLDQLDYLRQIAIR
jgi:hypothetical protein